MERCSQSALLLLERPVALKLLLKDNPKGFPVCFQSKFILQELEPRGCKVAMNEQPLCPLAQIILLCDNFPSLLRARKAVTRGPVGAEAVPWVQNLVHRRVVSTVGFPVHFVMGTFVVLVYAVILRGTRAGNISRFTCIRRLSWKPQGSAGRLITPARWGWQLGLQLEVQELCPKQCGSDEAEVWPSA